jgi:hypothetical protein
MYRSRASRASAYARKPFVVVLSGYCDTVTAAPITTSLKQKMIAFTSDHF